MRIAISSGHSSHVAGASGVIQEVPESRRVVSEVVRQLRSLGATVHEIHDNVSRTQAANLTWLINAHNAVTRDWDISVHMNHSGGGIVDRAIGTEVLHLTQPTAAARVSKAMADSGGLINRGAKHRTNLSWLNKTARPALILEVIFVNSREDVRLFRLNFSSICLAISQSILNRPVTLPPSTAEPPPAPNVCPTCKRPL
jgi:N-acetylmuramoyl-L-alanine amidase